MTALEGDQEIVDLLAHVYHDRETLAAERDGEYIPVREALERIVQEQPDWALVRYGRVLQQLAARVEELNRYRRNVTDEIDREIADTRARMGTLNAIFEAEALRVREEQGVKALSVPTIGEWKTRTVPGGWELPNDSTIIEHLNEADRPLLVQTVEVEKVDREAFRKYLDALVETDAEARDEIAEQYGVSWRDERISVKGPFNA